MNYLKYNPNVSALDIFLRLTPAPADAGVRAAELIRAPLSACELIRY